MATASPRCGGPRRSRFQRAESVPHLFGRTAGSLSLPNRREARTDDRIEQHISLGRCLTCGQELYQPAQPKKRLQIFRSKDNKRHQQQIPGHVARGQCLRCAQELSLLPPTLEELDNHNGKTSANRVAATETEQAVYKGTFNIHGERDGQGTMTWDNGDVYEGEFFNGNRHGHGTLKFADGSKYVGSWECNYQHGIGTRRWNNGDRYTGEYKNGKRTGEGKFYFNNGDLYVGAWVDGVMHGDGRYYYSSGQRFEGCFLNGCRHGKGKLQSLDGSIDIGIYEKDVPRGVGIRWSADRTQAWRLLDGAVKENISIPEAVALNYDIEDATAAFDQAVQTL